MAKNITILLLVQLILAFIAAFLFSQMSFIGRIGISLAYREYLVFKTAWKTTLIIFAIQAGLILLMTLIRYATPIFVTRLIAVLALVMGAFGAYLTYIDFTTTSHKHMKLYFHMGGYLFWFSWAITCFFFLFSKKKKKVVSNEFSLVQELPLEIKPQISELEESITSKNETSDK
ncbi:hypothetical protein [Myroides injenensis]|uniref:hypothetical protein n=1 Tax=Myroides injenensis TaxID=1183151 RepID=UPI00028934AD|nr:hypothetical protein [Myroides injenensis]